MKPTLVIVDDFENTLFVIEFTLWQNDFQILKAENGAEALRYFDGRQVDLLITDLNMPDLNGIELTKQVRLLPQYKRIPVLMLTSEKDAKKKQEALNSGVTAIVQKPFEREEFIKTVKRALNLF